MTFKSILSGAENLFTNFFTKAPQVVDDAFTSADKVVNIFKTFTTSVTGTTLTAIIEAFAPGSSAVVFPALNTFFADFNFLQTGIAGGVADVSAAGLSALNKLKGDSKTLALGNLASVVGHAMSNGNSTLQQAVATNQFVHDPTVLDLQTGTTVSTS